MTPNKSEKRASREYLNMLVNTGLGLVKRRERETTDIERATYKYANVNRVLISLSTGRYNDVYVTDGAAAFGPIDVGDEAQGLLDKHRHQFPTRGASMPDIGSVCEPLRGIIYHGIPPKGWAEVYVRAGVFMSAGTSHMTVSSGAGVNPTLWGAASRWVSGKPDDSPEGVLAYQMVGDSHGPILVIGLTSRIAVVMPLRLP